MSKLNIDIKVKSNKDGYNITGEFSDHDILWGDLVGLTSYFIHGGSLLTQMMANYIENLDESESDKDGTSIEYLLEIDMLIDTMGACQAAFARWLRLQGIPVCSCDEENNITKLREDPANLQEVHSIEQLLKRNDQSFAPFDISFRFFQEEENNGGE